MLTTFHDSAFDISLAQALHNEFLEEIARRKDIFLSRTTVNDSGFMPPLVDKHIRPHDEGLSATTAIPTVVEASRFEPYHDSFAASMLAAAADRMLKAGRAKEALPLAESAFERNIFDVWIQRVLLACRAELKGESWRIAETEEWLKTRFCSSPFDSLETTGASEMTVCCPLWLPTPIGTFEDESIETILNSDRVNRLRASILDRSFRHCSRMHCVKITQRELPAWKDVDIGAYRRRSFPKEVTFSHDPTCNLSCPSCRGHKIVISKSEQIRFDTLSRFLLPLMINADWVKVCGSGDPFASMHFRNLLRTYCADPRAHRNIALHTNGVLCDRRAWDDLGLGYFVKTVMFSLDAAREETYSYTRRGGDWSRALKNIRFLSGLRACGQIESIELLFVVQNKNFREMFEFIELAKEYGADKVLFQAISNWGTYSKTEFADHNIFSIQHPHHAAFVEMLSDPVFDDPIVDLFSVGKFRKAAVAAAPAPKGRRLSWRRLKEMWPA